MSSLPTSNLPPSTPLALFDSTRPPKLSSKAAQILDMPRVEKGCASQATSVNQLALLLSRKRLARERIGLAQFKLFLMRPNFTSLFSGIPNCPSYPEFEHDVTGILR